jgi:dipeptidyl-peptidase-4
LVKLLYGNSESQVTTDGKQNEILNGIPDWVYEEEFAFNRALEFSADNQMLAYIRFDESQVNYYAFPVFSGIYPSFYSYKYPKAGEVNSKVSVHSFDIKSKVTRTIQVPLDADGYIPRIRFTADANKLAVMTLNRHQNRFDLYMADPRTTLAKLALREENRYYFDDDLFDNIRFYPENFSFVSERSGYPHLYWYTLGGNLVKQVTSGAYEVTKFLGWDARENSFYYESNEESPLRNAVYKTDSKGKTTKLSLRTGTNSALFSASFKYFINTHSDLQNPITVTLHDNRGKVLSTLITNEKLKQTLAEYELPSKEFFTFTTSQGVTLNGWMIKPLHFSASQKYPALLFQYSGPGSQEVIDRWAIGGSHNGVGWEDYMASKGYVVVCVDGRGTGGRGAEFTKCTYLNLGVKEAVDQVETAKFIGSQPYVDSNRIGIWGWSFGGYMTIMSMSEGTPVFKAGAAVAPVTDWRYYDSIYGERFMRTPQENFDGYAASSAFSRADNLNGKLLLVHGMADDNVHFQNCAEYSECLVQANKQFEMQIYTNRDHGIYGGNTRYHLFTKLTEFFLTNL